MTTADDGEALYSILVRRMVFVDGIGTLHGMANVDAVLFMAWGFIGG
jgi:hypothetical protein